MSVHTCIFLIHSVNLFLLTYTQCASVHLFSFLQRTVTEKTLLFDVAQFIYYIPVLQFQEHSRRLTVLHF